MEVLVGSTFRSGVAAEDKDVPAALLLTEESSRGGNRIGLRRCVKSTSEESSSSVGVSGESSVEDEEDDAVSSQRGNWLGSFSSSLEDSLPIKRGLSNHYVGKSKSFGNLMEASINAKDLEKVESPLNKRRRLLIANKLRRRSVSLSSSSIYSKFNPKSMPLLALQESDEEDYKHNNDNDNDNGEDDDDSSDDETSKLQEKRMKMTNNRDFIVQTHSCFCLTSLQDDDDR